MHYLSLGEIVDLHQALLDQTVGATGIRDLGALESAMAQPRAIFDGTDLHPTTVQKAAALGFSLTLSVSHFKQRRHVFPNMTKPKPST